MYLLFLLILSLHEFNYKLHLYLLSFYLLHLIISILSFIWCINYHILHIKYIIQQNKRIQGKILFGKPNECSNNVMTPDSNATDPMVSVSFNNSRISINIIVIAHNYNDFFFYLICKTYIKCITLFILFHIICSMLIVLFVGYILCFNILSIIIWFIDLFIWLVSTLSAYTFIWCLNNIIWLINNFLYHRINQIKYYIWCDVQYIWYFKISKTLY